MGNLAGNGACLPETVSNNTHLNRRSIRYFGSPTVKKSHPPALTFSNRRTQNPVPLTPSLPHRRSRRLRRRVSPTAAVVLPPEALGSASLLLDGGSVPGCWARARIWSCAGLREVLLVAPDTAGSRGRRPRPAVIRPDSAGRLDLGAGTSEFFFLLLFPGG